MKKIIISLISLLSFTVSFSQINDNCINAIPLCSTPSFTFNANSGPGSIIDFSTTSTVSNPQTNPNPPNSGCLLQGELNPQWLLITIGNAGLLEFVFGAGNSANPQAGCYDWSMWPYSPTTCADILNNTLAPIRCNWNGPCNSGTGIASASNQAVFNGNAANFEAPLQVNACQQFIICISNYSGVNTLVSFQSLGTASLSCNPNCNPNYAICHGSSATIVPVNFAALANPSFSIQPGGTTNTTGSFVVTPTVTSSYTTFITGTNAVNAVQTITSVSTVTVNAQPGAAPTVTNTTCTSTLNTVNLNLTFNPPGPAPGYSITWSPIPNVIVGNPSQVTFTGGINPGLYNATITTVNGCTTTTSFSVDPLPAPAVINVSPIGLSHSITCLANVTLTALDATNNYTWSSIVGTFTGSEGVFTTTMTGTWLLTAVNPISGCASTQTFFITQNTQAPLSTISPSFQNITCNLSSITTISASANPSVNVTHQILAPQGGTFSTQSHTIIYTPGGIGTFTHCAVNDANGCSTCKTFTVASNFGFPTYSVTSPQNFTLGCGSTSVASISIDGGNTSPAGGPVSYTIIGPPTSANTPTGVLSGLSVYSVTVPGTWTVITKDNTSFCETRTPISILSNTFAPDISAIVPRQILDCNVPKTTLKGQSLTNNVSYLWNFPSTPGTIQGDTISVSVSTSPNASLIANYTLNVTNNSSTCRSFSVIPIFQNIYPPKAIISNGGTSSITCNTSTITLTNQSSTSIPPSTGFPFQLPVVGYLWDGPTPQQQGQLQTTYIAATVGNYTLTAKDLNNGCISKTTTAISDGKVYPIINKQTSPDILDCGSNFRTIVANISNMLPSYVYEWTPPAGASTSSTTSKTNSLTVNKIGSYRVSVTNTVTGCNSVANLSVINGTLTADFEVQPQKGFVPLNVQFFNNSVSSSTVPGQASAGITAYWNFGNAKSTITDPSNLSPSMLYNSSGTYTVTMYAVKGTCIDTAVKYISVEIPSVMEIPNVFTPNGDNVNDLFFLKAANLEKISISIYDRWGRVIFISESENGNISWDGKYQSGKEAADGTYFYLIKATGKDGQSFDKKGTVSLYR